MASLALDWVSNCRVFMVATAVGRWGAGEQRGRGAGEQRGRGAGEQGSRGAGRGAEEDGEEGN